MTTSYFRLAGLVASALLFGSLIVAALCGPAAAQVSSNDILNAIAPAPNRSLSDQALGSLSTAEPDRTFIDSLRHRSRSLSVTEGERVIALNRPKIDLEINFDYNSAEISDKARPQLDQLAEALRNPRVEGSVIVLGGHTDAKGGADYNQKLSQRRAESVKRYVEKLNVNGDNLSTVGYGKRHLKNTDDPNASENRRVQITNLSTNQAAR